jgi:FkbM family methyltransferase
MSFKQSIKTLVVKTPLYWPVLAYRAIANHERNNIKKGSNSDIQTQRNVLWFRDDPHNARRFNYDLNEDSIVFDVGGYNGEYTSAINNRYNCSIYIFEPVPDFFDSIRDRFLHNSRIHPFCLGLSNTTAKQSIFIQDVSSSLFLKEGKKIDIQLKNIIEFIDENNFAVIDLLKLNIEGAEYDLLECIIANNRASAFRNILVQFHDFIIPDAKDRMLAIKSNLSKTHFLTYSYEFVWENWQLK